MTKDNRGYFEVSRPFSEVLEEAEQGNIEAQLYIGKLSIGSDVDKLKAEGMKWLHKGIHKY